MSPESGPRWFGEWLKESGYRPATVRTRSAYAKRFSAWLIQNGIGDFRAVDYHIMMGFAQFLQHAVSERTGKPYRPSTRANLWCIALKVLAALYEAGVVPELVAPQGVVKVPAEPLPTILSEADVAALLDDIDPCSPVGLRDRALFELIYAAGLRVSEAVRLKWDDLNLNDRLAHITHSKFDKDRMVPLTHEAVEMLKRYRSPQATQAGLVFPGHSCRPLTTGYVNRRFKALATRSGVYRVGVTVHQLRHACATHMIAHGADIRYVQELLGHVSIQTTVRYTHDQVEQVRRIYRRFHPRENQLYHEVDDDYRQRIEALKAHVIGGRQKHLAKLRRHGYTGTEFIFQREAGQNVGQHDGI